MDRPLASSTRRVAIVTGIAVFAALAIYSYPYLATTRALQSKQVPFAFAADLSLYLNLSQMSASPRQPVVNPYYGTPMQLGQFGYLTFELGFKVFGWVIRALHHDLWWAVLLWSCFWWAGICMAAAWFLRLVLPSETSPVLMLGVSLLLFFNFGVLKALLTAWLHFPSLEGFAGLSLPYIRTFFPQAPVALLLFYLSFQVRALRSSKWYDWAAMWALQGIAFATFPYATLMMAGTTLVISIACLRSLLPREPMRAIIPYAVACAAVDVLFLLHRLHSQTNGPRLAILRFRPSHLPDLAGGAFVLLLLLTMLTSVLPPVGSNVAKWAIAKWAIAKWVMVGLGFSNVVLMLGDIVFVPALLVSSHAAYFLHCTISLQVTYLIAAAWVRFGSAVPRIKAVFAVAIFLVMVNGAILASASFHTSLPQNQKVSQLAQTLQSLAVADGDLVIARAETVDDLCSWVPLLTRGTVLFCRSAQYELSDSEKRGFHRLRQAFYLYFAGKDSAWVAQVVNDPGAMVAQDRLAFAGEIDPADKETSEKGRREIVQELIPQLARVQEQRDQMQERRDQKEEQHDHAEDFFRSYRRILLVDDANQPDFVRQRVLSYLAIASEQRVGDFVVLWCTALHAHQVDTPEQHSR